MVFPLASSPHKKSIPTAYRSQCRVSNRKPPPPYVGESLLLIPRHVLAMTLRFVVWRADRHSVRLPRHAAIRVSDPLTLLRAVHGFPVV